MKSLLLLFFVATSFKNAHEAQALRIKKIDQRIIGGLPAETTEYPYMAAIWKTTDLGRYFCGGAVISKRWILTAAHCVVDGSSFTVQVGSVKLTGSDVNRVTSTSTTSVIHPDFDVDTLINNIGLIQLKDELKFNDYVNVIDLPTAPLGDNTLCRSIGWGQTDDEHSGPVNDLYKVIVVSFAHDKCKNVYGEQITDNMLCAMGAYNEGTCIGDIGSPLILEDVSGPIHVGVASFLSGNGCESMDPSGYERTFAYLDWIKNVTGID